MSWVLFASLAALCESSKDLLSKNLLSKYSPFALVTGMFLFATVFLLVALFFVEIVISDQVVWLILALETSLYLFSLFCYFKAIQHSEISLVVPIVMFSPIFMLISSPLMIDEMPSELGFLGVLLIVVGSYILNLSSERTSWTQPIRALVSNKGSRYMLLCALIWSISANLDRIGINASSEFSWAILVGLSTSLSCFLLSLMFFRRELFQILRDPIDFLPIGFAQASMMIVHMLAVSSGLVVYVISIKRCSVLITILMARLFYRETSIKNRFLGALVMLVGVVLISLS